MLYEVSTFFVNLEHTWQSFIYIDTYPFVTWHELPVVRQICLLTVS